MKVTVNVTSEGPERPPQGAALIVQLRDTSLQDAPARTLASAHTAVGAAGATLATVYFDVPALPVGAVAWAHVDVDGDGRVSVGDYVTTRSYPVPPSREATVALKRV